MKGKGKGKGKKRNKDKKRQGKGREGKKKDKKWKENKGKEKQKERQGEGRKIKGEERVYYFVTILYSHLYPYYDLVADFVFIIVMVYAILYFEFGKMEYK